MAVAALSPVKILSDLGYEVWEMENDADMRSALIEAINTLTLTNPSDGRIPVLQDAVKNIQRSKFKTKKVSVDKLMNRKASSSQKVAPQKLLPAASEEGGEKDQTIITSNLAERLGNIQDALQSLGRALGQQLHLDKKVAAVDARNAKEEAKLAKENKLEKKKKSKFGGFGFKKLTKPVSGFFDTILNFFKNIFIGSILVGMLDWVTDPANKKRVDEFGKFFTEKAPWILGGIAALTAINIISPLLGFANALGWVGGSILGFLGKRMFPGTFGPQTSLRSPGGRIPPTPKIKSSTLLNRSKGISPRVTQLPRKPGGMPGIKGRNFQATRSRAPLIPKPGQGITPRVNAVPTTSNIGLLRKIPFRNVAKVLRVIGLGFLIAELKADWDRGDTRAVIAKLTAFGAGWLVTTLGLAAGGAMSVTGVGTVPGVAVLLGSAGAGAVTDHYVRKMLLGDGSQSAVVQQNQNVVQSTKVTSPPLTSSTNTGNIQFLDLRGGGASTAPVVSGGDGSGEEETVPSFSSQDPNNMTTVMVKSIYGLVN